jgi:hypothetical protein
LRLGGVICFAGAAAPRIIAREHISVPFRNFLNMALGKLPLGILALGCFAAALTAGPSFAGEQSGLYPPEVSTRPVIVVSGGGFARHYWDPRYAPVCPCIPVRQRLHQRANP